MGPNSGRLALGSEEFLEQLLERPKRQKPRREFQAALARRPDFSEIVAAIETFRGQSWAEFKEQRGDWGRDLALYLGRELGGITLAELGLTFRVRQHREMGNGAAGAVFTVIYLDLA